MCIIFCLVGGSQTVYCAWIFEMRALSRMEDAKEDAKDTKDDAKDAKD
jgi:hypothetical protein